MPARRPHLRATLSVGLIGLLLLVLLPVRTAHACSCVAPDPDRPSDPADDGRVVFSGDVVANEITDLSDQRTTFVLRSVRHGDPGGGDVVEVHSAPESVEFPDGTAGVNSCGIRFVVGEAYRVTAARDDEGRLHTGFCSDIGRLGTAFTHRLAGTDRIVTAVTVSAAVHEEAETVVLARADAYADALAGAPLAALLEAPLLLTGPARLADEAADEIRRLGASRVVLLGGTRALSEDVARDAVAAGATSVERLAGATRYETARLIAERLPDGPVYVVRGDDPDPDRGWPDAVAVSGLAAALRRPILLTEPDRLSEPTRAYLETHAAGGADRDDGLDARVVGGTAVISDEVVSEVGRIVHRGQLRLAGATRYETSRRVLDVWAAEERLPVDGVVIASGTAFPDALVAGPLAAALQAPLLLVDGRDPAASSPTLASLDAYAGSLDRLTVVGGAAAIPDVTLGELAARALGRRAAPPPAGDAYRASQPTAGGRAAVELRTLVPDAVVGGASAVVRPVNTGEVPLTYGLGYNVERWDGREWRPLDLQLLFALIGLGMEAGAAGDPEELFLDVAAGEYRVRKSFTISAEGTLRVAARFRVLPRAG